jgi:hypothetical protein
MTRTGSKAGGFRRVWGAPIMVGVLSVAGLAAALIGDGVLDAVSYVALSVPLAVILRYVARRTRGAVRKPRRG